MTPADRKSRMHAIVKLCGGCGTDFSCCQAEGCWCAEVGLTIAQLAWLRQHVNNCLCPLCVDAVRQGRFPGED